jgi:hypothetical protein
MIARPLSSRRALEDKVERLQVKLCGSATAYMFMYFRWWVIAHSCLHIDVWSSNKAMVLFHTFALSLSFLQTLRPYSGPDK